VDRLTKLRQNVFVRDFEFLPQTGNGSGGLPDVFFDHDFIDFFKDSYSRFLRAIDKDPNFEVSVQANGHQNGIPRDLIDGLRAQLDEQRLALEASTLEHAQELRRCEQRCSSLLEQATRDHATMKLHLSTEISGLQRQISEHVAETSGLKRQVSEQAAETSRLQQHISKQADDVGKLQRRIAELNASEEEATRLRNEHSTAMEAAGAQTRTLGALVKALGARFDEVEEQVGGELEKERAAKKDVQTELDDLLVVFADLEAKRLGDKKRLKNLGEEVSEDEDDDEDGEDDEDNDDAASE
jgi:chromosome segregation ATPase